MSSTEEVILQSLIMFPLELIKIIGEYCPPVLWKSTPEQSWDIEGYPTGIISHPQQQALYICVRSDNSGPESNSLPSYTFQGEKIKNQPILTLSFPWAIDIDQNNNLYIIGNTHVTILNLKKEKISSWSLPATDGEIRGLKIDNNIIYLVIWNHDEIYLFTTEGKIIKKFGKTGNGEGEFNTPMAITIDKKKIYICDSGNHRIQVLDKNNGLYLHQFGTYGSKTENQFIYPCCIYKSNKEDGHSLYVGDDTSIQQFTRDGMFLQRLKGFGQVFGICVCKGILYASDSPTGRVKVYRKQRPSDESNEE